VVDRSFHGTNAAVLALPTEAVSVDQQSRIVTLVATWRTDYVSQIVYGESYRRVEESFADFQQMVALSEVQTAICKYGVNTTTWPPAYQNIYAMAQQGWNYINAVRQTGNTMASNLPVDPTADSNWPARLAPITMPTY
jgi:hypothetical protein